MAHVGAAVLERWCASSARTRHWLINIAIGIAIVLTLNWAGNGLRLPLIVDAQNGAFDRMIRASAAVAPAGHEGLPPPPRLALIDVDDATWRDVRWGGGEPSRAPAALLMQLIESAFQRGAVQVVLDIAVEGSSGRAADMQENRLFAARLEGMLAQPWFGADRQLVLVRTVRQPIPVRRQFVTAAADTHAPYAEGYFDELREASAIDAVVAASSGRIVLAAPFFSVSSDRVLRDWQLYQVVCERSALGESGRVQVVPSVQLAVAARHFGLAAGAAPWQPAGSGVPCRPFPTNPLRAEPIAPLAATLAAQADQVTAASWRATRSAFEARGVRLGELMPRGDDLGNRVVFRWATPPNVIPAIELLFGETRHDLRNRVVLIGQTFPETVDRHYTPLGPMPGAVVLLNAIDSMTRHRIVGAPSVWVTAPLALAMIVVVGYAFARWSSLLGTVIATSAILAVLPWLSFSLFKYGVWLDFALPLAGIQVHKIITSMEEHFARRQLRRVAEHPPDPTPENRLPTPPPAQTPIPRPGDVA
jgi:CHASE2 domain